MKKRLLSLLALFMLLSASVASADSATVTSFTATPSTISNDYSIALSWSVSGGDAHELFFVCPEGVTLKFNGSAFPCDTRRAVSSNASDAVGINVINVSGTTKQVSVTVFPKSSGVANDAGAQTQTFTVTTASQPITDFTVSKAVTDSGSAVTFTWAGNYAPSANLQIDCVSGLTAYSGSSVSGTALPCGSPAFASDLGISSNSTITFVNTSGVQTAAVVHIMPAIKSGLYDSTHNLTASVAVNTQPLSTTLLVHTPVVTNFIADPASVISGVPFTVGWTTKEASSTNIQYSCSESLTLYSIGDATTTLPCGTPVFETALGESGTTTLMVISKTFIPQNLSIQLLPKDGNGIYQLSGAKTLQIPVKYQSQNQIPSTPIATVTGFPAASVSISFSTTSDSLKGMSHVPFFRMLARGSKGSEVVALQLFLGLNPAIYPENSASGFFGAATQRAVQKFQEKYGISKRGQQGYGSVGPKTRAKLNALTLP